MDFATTTVYMFSLCFVVSIGAIVFLEWFRTMREEKMKEELRKKYPHLKGII